MKHMLAPTVDGSRHTPAPATRSTIRHKGTSVHSDTAPNPRAHRKPKSIRNTAPKPSAPRGMAPSPDPLPESKPNRSRESLPSGRKRRGLVSQCNNGWRAASSQRRE